MLFQVNRFRGKINIQRPRAPCYEKARIFAVAEPVYKRKELFFCPLKAEKKKEIVDHPYERIIAKEVRSLFEQAKVIVFFHENPIKSEEQFNAAVAFKKQGMTLKTYSRKILRMALEDTKFEPVQPLFTTNNRFLFSPTSKVSPILKIVKKIPQLVLLAAVVENQLLTKNEFVAYSTMPDISTSLAQLVQTLNLAGSQIVNNVEFHQNELVNSLSSISE